MPNLCYGSVQVQGKVKDIVNFINDLKGKDGRFAMNNVLPLLVDMILDKSGCFSGFNYFKKEDKNNPKIQEYVNSKDCHCGENTINDNGTFDWHRWRLTNWGVKWDFDDYTNTDLKDSYEEFMKDINNKEYSSDDVGIFEFCYCCPWSYPARFLEFVSDKYNLNIDGNAEENGCEIYHTFDVSPGENIVIERHKMIDFYEIDGQDNAYILDQIEFAFDSFKDFKKQIKDYTENPNKWLKIVEDEYKKNKIWQDEERGMYL